VLRQGTLRRGNSCLDVGELAPVSTGHSA
jgi:hypothetical protein